MAAEQQCEPCEPCLMGCGRLLIPKKVPHRNNGLLPQEDWTLSRMLQDKDTRKKFQLG